MMLSCLKYDGERLIYRFKIYLLDLKCLLYLKIHMNILKVRVPFKMLVVRI